MTATQTRQLISVRVDKDVWRRVRMRSLERGMTAAQATEEALAVWLSRADEPKAIALGRREPTRTDPEHVP